MIDLSEQEQNLFYEALGHADLVKRNEFLDHACAGNDVLRARMEELLAVQARAEKFFAEAGLASDLLPNHDQK